MVGRLGGCDSAFSFEQKSKDQLLVFQLVVMARLVESSRKLMLVVEYD
jgi:hypothetical protein